MSAEAPACGSPSAGAPRPASTQVPAGHAAPAAQAELRAAGLARIRWAQLHRSGVDAVFALALLALVLTAGWLVARHDRYFDWTATGRHRLSPESLAVLERLQGDGGPLSITVFAPREHRIGRAVEQLVVRYRQRRPDLIEISWVDPQRFPERARDADVRLLGQLVLAYRGRRESLTVLSEAALSNAIARLALHRSPLVAVLEGHGERSIDGGARTDLGRFGQLLRQRGFRLQPLDLASAGRVPDNTDLVLISTPSIALFPGEAEALADYVAGGGNLLWLMEPSGTGDLMGLEPLAAYLGIRPLPGTVVDAAAAALNYDAPTFAVVADWPDHALGRDLDAPAVLPGSLAFTVTAAPGWLMDATLTTGEQSWNETGPIRGELTRDAAAGEEQGPLPVAMVLTRPLPDTTAHKTDDTARGALDTAAAGPGEGAPGGPPTQRVIVVGDSDFASNAHLANAENRTLALRMARWLTGLEDLITPPPARDDRDNFSLSPVRTWAISVGAVVLLPLVLLGIGFWLRWHRERG
jgi:hypothetical protein